MLLIVCRSVVTTYYDILACTFVTFVRRVCRLGSGVLPVGDVWAALFQCKPSYCHETGRVRAHVRPRSLSAARLSAGSVEARSTLSRLLARRSASLAPTMLRTNRVQHPDCGPWAATGESVLQRNGEIHGCKLHVCQWYDSLAFTCMHWFYTRAILDWGNVP